MFLLDVEEGEQSKDISFYPVIKLWIDKSFNVRAFMQTICGVWSPQKGVEISELGKNLFFFQFSSLKDRLKVLENQA